jgi:hypothetical protein
MQETERFKMFGCPKILASILTSIFPTGQAVLGLVSGKERKKGKKGECFGKLKPTHQWCRYPNPNVVPETGVWIIGDGESLPFRKVFYKCPRPEAHH